MLPTTIMAKPQFYSALEFRCRNKPQHLASGPENSHRPQCLHAKPQPSQTAVDPLQDLPLKIWKEAEKIRIGSIHEACVQMPCSRFLLLTGGA